MVVEQNKKFEAIALFGSPVGIEQLLRTLPLTEISLIVGASIRPQYLNELEQLAIKHSVPYLTQPSRSTIDYPLFLQKFKELGCKSILSHSYSMHIGDDLLNTVNGTAANIHYSLLPRNRGPNPIQWAIIKGEQALGTTLHLMNENFDAGDIIGQMEINILDQDTWVTMMEQCHKTTEDLLISLIPNLRTGLYTTHQQNESLATKNIRLRPDSPKIDFSKMTDREIFNLIRSQVKPLRGAYVEIENQKYFIDRIVPLQNIATLRKQYIAGKFYPQDLYE